MIDDIRKTFAAGELLDYIDDCLSQQKHGTFLFKTINHKCRFTRIDHPEMMMHHYFDANYIESKCVGIKEKIYNITLTNNELYELKDIRKEILLCFDRDEALVFNYWLTRHNSNVSNICSIDIELKSTKVHGSELVFYQIGDISYAS